jgi:Zn-dependent protease
LPRQMGRVTLDPRSHVSRLGLLLFIVIGVGWARPVLVQPEKFKRRRLSMALVAFAGPLSNLLLIVLTLVALNVFYWLTFTIDNGFGLQGALSEPLVQYGQSLAYYITITNMILFVFNLLPIPPLDGFVILEQVLPQRWSAWIRGHMLLWVGLLLVLAFVPVVRDNVLLPIFMWGVGLLGWISEGIRIGFGG